jgi:putative membrane protein
MDSPAEKDPRVYFAAERTLLAWIRTGLGLMGIGFAVSRFGLFLRQMSASESRVPAHTTGLSVWAGVAMVALGVIVNLGAALRHIRLVRELSAGTWMPGRVSRDAVILSLVLAAVGMGIAVYLVLVR